jgi:ribosomal protein S15P/S13E
MASQTPDGQMAAINEEIQAATAKTGSNPYQMRFDLLHLAKDILETNAHMAREDKDKDRQSFYTTEQVITTAKELNAFISNR